MVIWHYVPEATPLDLFICLDSSESITSDNYVSLKSRRFWLPASTSGQQGRDMGEDQTFQVCV